MKTLAIAAMAMIATPALAAPVALLCNGSGISTKSTMNDDLTWTHDRVTFAESFEVYIDAEAGVAKIDGDMAHIWSLTDEEVVVSRRKPNPLSRLLATKIAISRLTGVYRAGDATGSCAPRSAQNKLF